MDHATRLQGPVRIAAPMSFGLARPAPLLPGFISCSTRMWELQLHFSDSQVDLIAERLTWRCALPTCKTPACWRAACAWCGGCWWAPPPTFSAMAIPVTPAIWPSTARCTTATSPAARPGSFAMRSWPVQLKGKSRSCTPTMPKP